MDTKEYILTNITQLFNRQGFASTSLRQAAAYLDMSDGNLRYHFKDKEVLVMDLFLQMRMELELVLQLKEAQKTPLKPEEIREQLRAVFFTMYRYKFLFIESNLLLKQYPSFRKVSLKLRKVQKEYVQAIVNAYLKKGLLATAHGHSSMLFEQLFILSDSWIKYVDLEELVSPISIDEKIDHYVDLCLNLLSSPC